MTKREKILKSIEKAINDVEEIYAETEGYSLTNTWVNEKTNKTINVEVDVKDRVDEVKELLFDLGCDVDEANIKVKI